MQWETTVGDDRETLLRAFQLAGERADAVIVNGGLGPTVDDLSQEIAAQAAGVELVAQRGVARAGWRSSSSRRSRVMPPNNRKQAMLPATAEVIDNPIGTACGFALDIGRARFFFTPGRAARAAPHARGADHPAPAREERPARRRSSSSGSTPTGSASRTSTRCSPAWRTLVPDGSVKLGFRAHYPQLETKLTVRGADMDDIRRKLAPVEREVRKRLGNFILAEDDQTLEGVVLAELAGAAGHARDRRDVHERADRRAHRPPARARRRSSAAASWRATSARCAPAVGLDGRAAGGRAHAARPPRRWRAPRGGRPAPPTRWRC